MVKELDVIDHLDTMNKVVAEMLKGNSPTQIAQLLKMKRYEVLNYIDEWQKTARSSKIVQDRAKDAISGADQHFSMIIFRLWDTVEQAEMAGTIREKTTALVAIANIEEKRIGMLQKAGLLDNQELAAQIAETERKQKILVEILRDVAQMHPDAKNLILTRLAKVTGEAEGVTVPGTVIKKELYPD